MWNPQGHNAQGQVGDGTSYDRDKPVWIGKASDWQSVGTGYAHTCAIRADNGLWCWGYNEYGQVGNGTTVDEHRPHMVHL